MAAAGNLSDRGSILALNAGSSSLKFGLFAAVPSLSEVLRGEISELATAPHLVAHEGVGGGLGRRSALAKR